ncbi:MAG: diaminopimelate decarboxylase [Fusobacterium sp.]|nr:diaminopimelate decarboxylase [Fusobacterium sp.]
MKLNGNAKINEKGTLIIDGVSTLDLVEKYGTPLFVYDESLIREQCRRFHRVLSEANIKYHISYASKAFLCKQMVILAEEEKMGLDVVSMGELNNALIAKFPAEKIHLHGNNKTEEEIRFAIENNVGCFVLDSFSEIEKVNEIAAELNRKQKCILRLTPGVEAHTHEYVITGKNDSKFGLNIENGQAKEAVKLALSKDNIDFVGFHFHIGSQIFGTEGTRHAINIVFEWLKALKEEFNYLAKVLNIGGGFSIRYTNEDISYPIETALKEIINELKNVSKKYELALPELWLEPGRSIVGEAGNTLYRIGTIKEIPNVRNYVSIDGGMSDHIRTALYGAKYEVAIANKMNKKTNYVATIVGKCCESGDVIAREVKIAEPEIGDIAVVSCTGAYHYSMASNYNQLLRPAVVFVRDGESRLVIKRESFEDIVRNQI